MRGATDEIGTGTYTAMSQFAADTLNILLEQIRFELGDSQFPIAPNNGGSWLTASVEPAIMGACGQLKKQVVDLAGSWPGGARNPRLARSQIMGGMLFGFSTALMEATVPDEKTGRIVNPNLADYHVAVHADAPEFDIDFINEPDPYMADLGARGIGEIGIVGAPAAVANAVFNASGKRVRDLPITPDKLP